MFNTKYFKVLTLNYNNFVRDIMKNLVNVHKNNVIRKILQKIANTCSVDGISLKVRRRQ